MPEKTARVGAGVWHCAAEVRALTGADTSSGRGGLRTISTGAQEDFDLKLYTDVNL